MSLFRRIFAPLFGRTAIEAASVGRRWAGLRPITAPKETIAASRSIVMDRARSLVLSNALAASGVSAWENSLIGSGILARSTHPSARVRKRLDRAWAAWCKTCDADGRLSFEGIQSLVARRIVVDGECLVLMLIRNGKLRLRVLSSEQLSDISQIALPNGNVLASGIEFNSDGERVAYYVHPTPPGAVPTMQPVRIPAADVLHVYRPDYGGQLRGLSWFAPVLLALSEHGKLSDAATIQQQIAAMLCGFIVTPEGDVSKVFPGERDQAGALIPSLEPGSMVALDPQQDIRFSNPPRSTGPERVLKASARLIAAGLNLPYECLSGDLEAVNYSSIRAGLVEFRRRCEALQFAIFGHQLIAPIFARFVSVEALAGRLYAPGDLQPYGACEIFPPKNQWVDPLKDAEAEALAISSGLMSRTEALAARGWSAEEVDAAIANDRAREKALGLSFQPVVTQPQKQNEAVQ